MATSWHPLVEEGAPGRGGGDLLRMACMIEGYPGGGGGGGGGMGCGRGEGEVIDCETWV
jgi:hypothetical protein